MVTNYEPLQYTGERMVPEKAEPSTYWEHIYRYRFAVPYVAGRRVLDIACGEGYGAAAFLKAGASSVIGVDISEETCRHARSKYGIDARIGDAQAIPLPDQSVDVIVSFETIEHVPEPAAFLAECARVLAPGGRIIISTPNKDIYRFSGEQHNPFHCSELTKEEFDELLSHRFVGSKMFMQNIKFAPCWSLCSLAAEGSFWQRTRGLGRLSKTIRSLLCPHIREERGDERRLSTVEEILKKDSSVTSAVNPYAVREESKHKQEKPTYVIAVAEKRALK